MLNTVLWDMDGTLLDSEPTALAALNKAMAAQGIEADQALLDSFIGMAADDIYAVLKSRHGLSLDTLSWEQAKQKNYLNELHKVQAFSDAVQLWQQLQMNGVPQAIVTNSDRIVTDANLCHIGLSAPGMRTVTRNDVIFGKPHPEPYLRAAELLGRKPENCLVIEDSASGLAAGLSAGMSTVLVPSSEVDSPKQVQKLKSFSHVFDLLKLAS